jgi:sugar phosphate isomerase/epimerase
MGCSCLHYSVDFPETQAELSAIRAATEEYGIELELRGAEMGRLRNVFELTGPNAGFAREDIAQRIRIMKRLGIRIMRLGYGSLRIEKSRFAPDGRRQLETIGKSLREAAKIMEDNDVYLAVENHCDFKGADLAAMFDFVDSRMSVARSTPRTPIPCSTIPTWRSPSWLLIPLPPTSRTCS